MKIASEQVGCKPSIFDIEVYMLNFTEGSTIILVSIRPHDYSEVRVVRLPFLGSSPHAFP